MGSHHKDGFPIVKTDSLVVSHNNKSKDDSWNADDNNNNNDSQGE